MRHQLFHVVLLLFICGIAVISAVAGRAYACDYDKIKKKVSSHVVVGRNIPKKGEDSSQTYTVATSENGKWEPLRIRVSTKDLIKEKYCEEENEWRMNFLDGEILYCSGRSDSMTEEKKNTMINEILPEAIKLHTDRLLVQRMKSPLQVPVFNNNSICSRFTVPSGHHAPGVPDADFVLYVAAGPSKNHSFCTWAVTCAIDTQSQRPIVGAMNIHPENAFFTRVNVRYAAHVLSHALGFDYENMKERKMTKEVTKEGEDKTRTVIKSKKVLETAKEHYGCQELKGVQLERAGKGQPTSHWDRGNAKDELMSMQMSRGWFESIGYYTALTISAFEDMKFYRGNFEMAENMTWGYHKSCKFLDTACKDKLKRNVSSNMGWVGFCTSDRHGWSVYYEPTENTSTCPILRAKTGASCVSEYPQNLSLGLSGKDSWCLDADSIKSNDGYTITKNGVCAGVKCDDGVVKIQLKENGEWHNCTNDNASFTPNQTYYPKYKSGKIKCPKYSEVCTIRTNGSSRLRLQEEKNITLEIPEITASITTGTPDANVPSSPASHAGQNSQTSTVNNVQQAPSTSTETGGNRKGRFYKTNSWRNNK